MSRPFSRTALLATTVGLALVLALAAGIGWWLVADDEPDASPTTTATAPSPSPSRGTEVAAHGEESGATAVALPTHAWRPGDAGDDALISGTLIADRHNCVALSQGGGVMTYALWPAGYSAVIGTDGAVRLKDASGTVVAETGDQLTMGGGFGAPPSRDVTCVPKKGEVALVQSDVTVTKESEHWQPREAAPTGSPKDPAYLAWRARTPLRSCGEQFIPPFLDGTALRYADCLRNALEDGRAAEAVVTFTTVEGDPVVRYLRVRRNGAVEVFTDSTQDKFGSRAWEQGTCRRLEEALRFSC
ncbi:hypothetical protein ACLM5J_08135 [Nocardioides sp. Bht2]|uniref:hypothetical protein n=1 Tax=Nocardioides sp. Bht2 TaxID=3392297 RepID=UPI0039B621CB